MKKTHAIISSATLVVLLSALCVSGQKDQKNEPEMLIKAASFLEEKPFDKGGQEHPELGNGLGSTNGQG